MKISIITDTDEAITIEASHDHGSPSVKLVGSAAAIASLRAAYPGSEDVDGRAETASAEVLGDIVRHIVLMTGDEGFTG